LAKGRRKAVGAVQDELEFPDAEVQDSPDGDGGDDLVPEGKLVCALTGDFRKDTDQERTLQQLIEQLHREYGIAYEDMVRDVRLPCYGEDPETGRVKTKSSPSFLVSIAERSQPCRRQ
jgi:type I restriction enzyme M protein